MPAVPLAFEENDGQLAPEFSFLGRARNYSIAIEHDRLRFFTSAASKDSDVDVRFGGSRGGSPVSLSSVAYCSNYFIGSDPSHWHHGVANFSRVGIRQIYPGIDTEFYDRNGEFEHDFILAPNADPKAIRLDVRSARHFTLTAQGEVVIPEASGELRFRKPVAFQFDAEGKRIAVEASYRLTGNSLRFALGSYDRSRTLVIDPVILFATYVSGTSGSTPAQMTTDGNGTIFLAGSTPTATGFPSSTNSATVKSGSGSNVFVAAVNTTKLGSVLEWITFLGNTGTSTATSIAYSSNNSGTVYVGGTTSSGNFPGVPASGIFNGTFPTGSGHAIGFTTSLNAGTGAAPRSTYIATGLGSGSKDLTAVSGLAADNNGNVYIAGYGLGIDLSPTANSLGGTSAVPATAGTTNNAFVIELDPTLKTGKLVTYLQSATAADYKATVIQLDNSNPANIYVAGTVGGGSSVQFPSSKSFSAAGAYDSGQDFTPCSRNTTNTSAFLAQIQPPTGSSTHSTLGFSMFTCADTTSGSETARGLAVGANSIYLVGDTLSPDLAAGVHYSTTTQDIASFTGGLQSAIATGNTNGYAIQIPISGTTVGAPSAFTFLGGTSSNGNTTLHAVAMDPANKLVHLVGQTSATRASMPGSGLPGLSIASMQDSSGDSIRAFLYTFDDGPSPLPAPLTEAGLKSISYLGDASTSSKALGAIPDTAGSGAYVLIQDSNGATGSSFLSSDAAGIATPSQSNTYLADVQGTNVAALPAPGLVFAPVSTNNPEIDDTPCSDTCEIAYNSATDNSTVKYSWNLSAGADASNVVLNFLPERLLSSPYSIEEDGTPLSTCATAVTVPASNGSTCSIPLLSGAHTITLTANASANAASTATPNPIGSGFQLQANAADAAGEYEANQQPSVTVANPVSISLRLTQSQDTVDAANGTSDTGSAGHVTEVVYTATVQNTSNNDSPNTTLKITPPTTAAYHIVSATATVNGAAAAGCQTDGSGCTKVDVPASQSLIYTVTAQYLAANLSSTTPGATQEQLSATATALPLTTNNKQQNANVTTQVNGYAALTVNVQAPNYPGTQTAFNLNSGSLTYIVTVSNSGPNAAAFSLANTLPTGFKVSSASCAPAVSVCDATAGSGFTVNAIASGSTVTYTINGSFPDNGTGADAVPLSAPSATVADSATITPVGTFNPNTSTATSASRVVQRSVHLKLTLTTSTTSLSGPGYTAPAYNLGTAISYVYTINNDGPNVAVNVPFTSAIAITSPSSYSPPSNYVTVVTPVGGGLTCTPTYTSCTVSSVPVNGSSSFTFTVTYPDNPPPANIYPAPATLSAVPTNASTAAYKYSVTTPALYTNAVDSNPNATTAGDNNTTYSVNIYRTVHLKLILANSGPAATGTSYTQPAYNLGATVSYAYTIQNSGPNIALNVPLTSLLSAPSGYTPPAGSYTITPPSLGGLNCTPNYTACALAAIAKGSSDLTFAASYSDNPPTTYAFPTQDLSAVPSNAASAVYNYSVGLPASAYVNAIDANPAATAGGDNAATSLAHIYRTAALSLTPSVSGPGTPCAPGTPSPCLYMANSGNGTGLNDTATYSVAIKNDGPDLATNSVLTIPLPTNLLVTANPALAFNGLATTGVVNQLVCSYQSTSNAIVCQGYVPTGISTATLTSKFSTSTVPATAAFTTTATSPNTPGSGSVTASAIGGNNSTTLPTVAIDRAAHLIAVKHVGPATGNISPNGLALNGVLAVNLDEKVTADAAGKNDTVQITQQIGNAGLNDATGVVITDTLPPYFIVTKLPSTSLASCTVSGPTTTDGAGNPMTGAAPATLTCTLQNPVPSGTGVAGVGSSHGTVTGAFTQLVYYGKFEDNGLQPDAIPSAQSSTTVQFASLSASSADIINLDSASDSTSASVVPVPVMRAAHLHFTLTQYVQPGDSPLNPVGGTALPAIAEAQLGANGAEVINPVRYQVRVTNDGPNIATSPVVTTTLPPNPGGAAPRFVNVSLSIEPSSTPGFPIVPPGCTSLQSCEDAGVIAGGASVFYNVDGNFDVNTLVEGNSGARTFASAITSSGVVDSNPAATAGGDQRTSLPITVVNTPAGANFTLAPFAGNLTQPFNLKLATVQVAGVTGLVASGAAPAPVLPSGRSPNPSDNGANVPLYRFGQGGVYYTLGTTAAVSSATTNPTMVCLTSIPDTFQKPERVLLWALSNAPSGTAFGAIPHYTGNGTVGDITTLVIPQGGGTYAVPAPNTSYPPPPAQPQPAQVCGVLNGLANATNPTMLALLEPVNFAPYIRTAVTAANASNSQPGKGVTAAAAQVDLTISPQNNYDYNDADPCYTGSNGTTRSTCNDNLQMTTFLFGGGNLIGDAQQVHTYFYGDLQATPKPQFNLPAGQPQLYLVLADQLGAQGYKEMTSGGNTQVCDPGNPSSAYTPTTPACPLPTPLPTGIAVPPAQTALPLTNYTSVEVALLTGNVGFGGSTGLIPLPQTPTPQAVAHVTAGQTAGFVWNWLTEQPQVQSGNMPPTLTLSCTSTDGINLAEKGIQCNVPQTYSYSTGMGNSLVITTPPAIYVVTTSNTAVGVLGESPLSQNIRVVAAIVFPLGVIPLVFVLRRRRALKLTGWLAIVLFTSLVGLGIGCGGAGFKNQGGTTATATPAATYQFVVTATGTDSGGNTISIKTYPFAVTVSAVQ